MEKPATPESKTATESMPGDGNAGSAAGGAADAEPVLGGATEAGSVSGGATEAGSGAGGARGPRSASGVTEEPEPADGVAESIADVVADAEPVAGGAAKAKPAAGGAAKAKPASGDVEDAGPAFGDATDAKPTSGDAEDTEPAAGGAGEAEPLSGDAEDAGPVAGVAADATPLPGDAEDTEPAFGDATDTKPASGDVEDTEPAADGATHAKPISRHAADAEPADTDAKSIARATADTEPAPAATTNAEPQTQAAAKAKPASGDAAQTRVAKGVEPIAGVAADAQSVAGIAADAQSASGVAEEPEPKHEAAAAHASEDDAAAHVPGDDARPVADHSAKPTAKAAANPAGGSASPGRTASGEARTDAATDTESTEGAAETGTPSPAEAEAPPAEGETPTRPRRRRTWRADHPLVARVLGIGVTLLAGVIVVASLVLPNRPQDIQPAYFTRLPVEALIGAVVLTALPRRTRLVTAWLGGIVLGVMTLLNLLDIGFNQYLGRGFNVILDWPLFSDAYSYLKDTLGGAGALGTLIAVIAIVLAVLVVSALAVVRLSNLMVRHRATTTRVVLVLSMVWMTCQSLSLQYQGVPVAADRTVSTLQFRSDNIRQTIRDEREFAKIAKVDAFGNTPASQLVPDLRGKDMIFTFIESYGRSAIEDPIMAPGVDKTLDDSTAALAKAGFHAKSGWLTSATYGGSSWLGHSTFLSGLWIDNQNRYRTVTASDHLSLTKAFKKTGAWDTVGIMPGVQKGWPEAKFYGLDKVYNAFQMGYKGPKFSWSTMPDQYALEAFQRLEHSKKRDKPLMSEIILTSSHTPWAPIPQMVGWDQLGNGSIFDGIQKAGHPSSYTYTSDVHSKEEYGKSVQYSVTSLTQFLERYGNDNTVLVFLGDHQANAHVSGNRASHDVPCVIVAKDPKVLAKIADWGWSDGLRPAHNAPVWKMSSFRDRFLTAFGSTPHPSKG
ncbi:CDP-alcohol phosphatidyltransferase [Streptomyces sp. NPDC001795]|uniref:CDP-alcohol phosphatidyltransferase n=1 Tax=Streptomyces sp. NPDC001795 TaxID=3154525 RepID=UPI00332664B1